jgi:hypothetical protein
MATVIQQYYFRGLFTPLKLQSLLKSQLITIAERSFPQNSGKFPNDESKAILNMVC